MPGNKPRYKVFSKEFDDPDGNRVSIHEVCEAFMVDGIEKLHRNSDQAFTTEQEAEDWIKQQYDKSD